VKYFVPQRLLPDVPWFTIYVFLLFTYFSIFRFRKFWFSFVTLYTTLVKKYSRATSNVFHQQLTKECCHYITSNLVKVWWKVVFYFAWSLGRISKNIPRQKKNIKNILHIKVSVGELEIFNCYLVNICWQRDDHFIRWTSLHCCAAQHFKWEALVLQKNQYN
jgi:hypothetical protein